MDNSLAGGYQPRRTTGGNSDGGDVPVLPWPSLVEPSESLPGRIEVPVAIAGLRHLEASAEPALVFSHLAAVCVPAVCDDVVIDLVENGHGYRIRRPAPSTSPALPVAPPGTPSRSPSAGPVLGRDTVTVSIDSSEPGQDSAEAGFAGTLVCSWRDGYVPAPADAALIGLMVDHAVALIHRERLTGRVIELRGQAQQLSSTLTRNGRIAAAVGVVMALHHVDRAQAIDLLVRIGDRTDRDLQDVADSVVHTRALPKLRPAETAT
jgi:hypothetical protein